MVLEILDNEYTGSLEFNEYPFKLSNFQKNAIQSYHNGSHVFVAAPTGSGKTLPAEHAIQDMINNGKKVIYTSPIKTLSNQKFYEFKQKFKNADVGILTGDIKFNPTGNVIIMTTEILRNLLFNKSIQDIKNKIEIRLDLYNDFSLVIFDEIHYINDKDRGAVWEQSIILLPKSVQLIMLSATINNPEEFCEWINHCSKLKQPIDKEDRNICLCSTNHRVVPLRHGIFTFYTESYLNKTKELENCEKIHNKLCIFSDNKNKFNSQLYQNIASQESRSRLGLSRYFVYSGLVEYLTYNKLTPCIVFCFSRKECENLLKHIPFSLLDGKEQQETNKIINHYLRKCDNYESYISMDQYHRLNHYLQKGLAFHHSGLLPVFKEIVEILYSKNLVKVLFATETFAVGVNMPTKTVIFHSLEKYSDNDFRMLHTHEYLQMAGRAGRRGIDTQGTVILLTNTDYLPPQNQMYNLICGNSQSVRSKFNSDYQLILKVISNGTGMHIFNHSLLSNEIDKDINLIEQQIKKIDLPNKNFDECIEYDKLQNTTDGLIKLTKSQIKENKKKAIDISNQSNFNEKYKEYMTYKKSINEKEQLSNRQEGTRTYISSQVNKTIEILYENNYINIKNIDDKNRDPITIKGKVASEINECNSIMLTELVFSDLLDNIDFKDLGALLSIFGDSTKTNNKDDITSTYYHEKYDKYINLLNEVSDYYINYENSLELYTNLKWSINIDLIEPTYRWLDNENFEILTTEYKIFEGNLIKDFLKIYNLSAEVEKIAEMLNKNNLVIEASKLKENILRDIVSVESLYIK